MSEVLDPPVAHPVTDAVGVLLAALDGFSERAGSGAESGLWTMSGPELLETTATVYRALCRTAQSVRPIASAQRVGFNQPPQVDNQLTGGLSVLDSRYGGAASVWSATRPRTTPSTR